MSGDFIKPFFLQAINCTWWDAIKRFPLHYSHLIKSHWPHDLVDNNNKEGIRNIRIFQGDTVETIVALKV